jgi:hypothetical protein
MIEKTKQAEGLGVFYWEPTQSISKGAWDLNGSPTIAMDAFIDNSALSLEEFKNSTNLFFKVFPNPSSERVTIGNSKFIIESIHMYDIAGRLIKEIKGRRYSQTLNISNLKSGIYILKINNTQFLKFLKKE